MSIDSIFIDSNDGSEQTEGYHAIVPLVTRDKSTGILIFIGTAFYISQEGLLVTAKHCVWDEQAEKVYDNLGVCHIIPGQLYRFRRIVNLSYSTIYDIAYLKSEIMVNANRGELVKNNALILSADVPRSNDQLGICGYPNSVFQYQGELLINSFFNLSKQYGECREYHHLGFGLLKNPCFRTSIKIMPGASGGPVFDKNGLVFAVCSTGYSLHKDDDGENISFITPIRPTLLMASPLGEGMISDLIQNGTVKVKTFE